MYKRLVSVGLVFLLVSGCSPSQIDKAKDAVQRQNLRTSQVLLTYSQSKDSSSFLWPVLKKALVSGDWPFQGDKRFTAYGRSFGQDAITYTSKTRDLLSTEIKGYNTTIEENNQLKQKLDLASYVESNFTQSYYVDDKTGLTEQNFRLKLPSGKMLSFSFFWAGGAYVESSSFGLD